MWIPYAEVRKHQPDFRVKYRIYSAEEGGRKTPVYQGLRCDFAYAGDDAGMDRIYAIHPEFEEAAGKVIRDRSYPVPPAGTATMWILFPEMRREVHLAKMKPGVTGFMMEGPKRIAEVEVIEIVGLYHNAETL
ncbi:hypothetical protein [Paenibacillus sp. GCM10027626]|uniref:hypothetical protein n=1 Tax=Paenibacillus sp. GCM10027626 TaxID=3273411 RepID=UPI00362A1D4E